MNRSKFFLASRGIIGGIIPVFFGVLILLGYQVDPQMQADATEIGDQFLDTLLSAADGVALVVAGVLGLWSRLRAERKPLRASLRG
jgi:hypothetical protein